MVMTQQAMKFALQKANPSMMLPKTPASMMMPSYPPTTQQ